MAVSPEDAELQTGARHLKHDQYILFTDKSSHHATINDEMLMEKAKILGEQLNIADLILQRLAPLLQAETRGEADRADKGVVTTREKSCNRLLLFKTQKRFLP